MNDDADADTLTVWTDNALLLLGGFVLIAFLLIQTIVVKPKDTTDITSPGSVIVTIVWPAEIDADVDLWVQAPGDVPVGYSSPSGRLFNLLRDDLGFTSDITKINLENAYTRGASAGEYIVNVHAYHASSDSLYPIPVTVVVQLRNDNGSTETIGAAKIILTHQHEEITAIRFTLDALHRVSNINHVQRKVHG